MVPISRLAFRGSPLLARSPMLSCGGMSSSSSSKNCSKERERDRQSGKCVPSSGSRLATHILLFASCLFPPPTCLLFFRLSLSSLVSFKRNEFQSLNLHIHLTVRREPIASHRSRSSRGSSSHGVERSCRTQKKDRSERREEQGEVGMKWEGDMRCDGEGGREGERGCV